MSGYDFRNKCVFSFRWNTGSHGPVMSSEWLFQSVKPAEANDRSPPGATCLAFDKMELRNLNMLGQPVRGIMCSLKKWSVCNLSPLCHVLNWTVFYINICHFISTLYAFLNSHTIFFAKFGHMKFWNANFQQFWIFEMQIPCPRL